MSGPMGLTYKNYFTMDANSSIFSIPLCHFGHTSTASLFVNSAALWTLGHYHVTKYGCARFAAVLGVSYAIASGLGVVDVRQNAH